jgi:hypothetical protein
MPDPDDAPTSDSFDFEKLFDAPQGEPLPNGITVPIWRWRIACARIGNPTI